MWVIFMSIASKKDIVGYGWNRIGSENSNKRYTLQPNQINTRVIDKVSAIIYPEMKINKKGEP